MNSINTNFAALTALESLNQTNKSMLETQKRISTGFRVASAEDNAAYWSMATSMRSDNKSLSAVSDALGLGAATIDVAYTAMNSSIDVVSEIKVPGNAGERICRYPDEPIPERYSGLPVVGLPVRVSGPAVRNAWAVVANIADHRVLFALAALKRLERNR